MAVNPSAKSNYLSKVQLSGGTYWVKDAELRELLESAATKTAIEQIITSGEGANNTNSTIPTTLALTTWLEAQIQGLTGAMHFAGVTDPEDGDTFDERVAALYGAESPEAGDIVIDGTKEYVYDGSAWKELGDEGTYATKAELETAVSGIQVAGVALGQDHAITAAELITALGLKALAFKDEASGTVSTIDSGSVSIPEATLTLSGTAIAVPQTFSSLDVTPAGTVTATAATVGIQYDKFSGGSVSVPDLTNAQYQDVSSIAVTAAAAGDGDTANYTPAGTVTLPGFTGAFTAATTSVATVTDAGTAYTLSGGSVSQAADSTSAFATEGVTAAMDTNDPEMLVFSAAGTTNAVTASGAVTFTTPTLSGALPTFGSAEVATGGTVSVTANGAASFAGAGAVISATANKSNAALTGVGTTTSAIANPTYSTIDVVVPAQEITASFSGTAKSVTPAAATSANAAPADATAAVAAQTITVDFVRTNKNVTVS